MLDDFDFDVTFFIEYLQTALFLSFQLLNRVKECETKMKVLTVLIVLIERVDDKVHIQIIFV